MSKLGRESTSIRDAGVDVWLEQLNKEGWVRPEVEGATVSDSPTEWWSVIREALIHALATQLTGDQRGKLHNCAQSLATDSSADLQRWCSDLADDASLQQLFDGARQEASMCEFPRTLLGLVVDRLNSGAHDADQIRLVVKTPECDVKFSPDRNEAAAEGGGGAAAAGGQWVGRIVTLAAFSTQTGLPVFTKLHLKKPPIAVGAEEEGDEKEAVAGMDLD